MNIDAVRVYGYKADCVLLLTIPSKIGYWIEEELLCFAFYKSRGMAEEGEILEDDDVMMV